MPVTLLWLEYSSYFGCCKWSEAVTRQLVVESGYFMIDEYTVLRAAGEIGKLRGGGLVYGNWRGGGESTCWKGLLKLP